MHSAHSSRGRTRRSASRTEVTSRSTAPSRCGCAGRCMHSRSRCPTAHSTPRIAAMPVAFAERYVAAYGVDPGPKLQLTALRVRVVRPTRRPTSSPSEIPPPGAPRTGRHAAGVLRRTPRLRGHPGVRLVGARCPGTRSWAPPSSRLPTRRWWCRPRGSPRSTAAAIWCCTHDRRSDHDRRRVRLGPTRRDRSRSPERCSPSAATRTRRSARSPMPPGSCRAACTTTSTRRSR